MPPNSGPRRSGFSLADFLGQQYYRHGLFCATHPKLVLTLTFFGVLWTCLPLLSLPIYSGEATLFTDKDLKNSPLHIFANLPHWASEQNITPVAFILPVVMKAMVQPYRKEELIRTDAFRGPLASVFKLHLEDIAAFKDLKLSTDMESECLRTDGISASYRSKSLLQVLPEYGCLILSPANLWQKSPSNFQTDSSIISTIFNYQRSSEGQSSAADILFGFRLRETGFTKYPVRNRQRVISYGVTIVLKRNNKKFVKALTDHLKTIYSYPAGNSSENDMVHMFFPSRSHFSEVLPFFLTLLVMFLYVYFSCKKIDLVYSKIGVAFCSVVNVLCSIMLSLALSGLTLNMNSKMCVIPYLVAFIGLENLMVITRSVVTTKAHLDIKIRVAKGLSREGWNITKNLFTEITILTLGFFIGILDPSIQEFCLLLVMGLISDFFLQTFFFTSVLALDMNRMELSDVARKPTYKKRDIFQHPISGPGYKKTSLDRQTSVMAPQVSQFVKEAESKRVRFINFWAKRRIIQRLFSLSMIVWISMFVYQTSLLETVFRTPQYAATLLVDQDNVNQTEQLQLSMTQGKYPEGKKYNMSTLISKLEDVDSIKYPVFAKLSHVNQAPWKKLPHSHWRLLFDIYNISLQGKFLTILPTVHLSMIISPEGAKQIRHPQEELQEEATTHSVEGLKNVLESSDDEESELDEIKREEVDFEGQHFELSPFFPTSTNELLFVFLLALPSVTFLVYAMTVVYRCVCSRNYAEWRSSWNASESKGLGDIYTQVVQESVPIIVDGHNHQIESLVINGNLIISLCLGGRINIWDSYSGEKITTLQREDGSHHHQKRPPNLENQYQEKSLNFGLSPKMKINVNFSSRSAENLRKRSGEFMPNKCFRNEAAFLSDQDEVRDSLHTSIVWSMDCDDEFLVLGCSNGHLELWNVREGKMIDVTNSQSGVTHLKLVGNRLVAARIAGNVDFYSLDAHHEDDFLTMDNSVEKCSRRSHVRSFSTSTIDIQNVRRSLSLLRTLRSHQQPITCLEFGGGNVLTGSMDHTIHVFRLEDVFNIFTLHGHCGPITTAFIDPLMTNCAGSGSQDGMVCVWDLLTGACVYSILAHDGAVLSLAHSPSYVISLGADGKLCVWERFHGHLINSISIDGKLSSFNLTMLTHNLMVTSSRDSLVVWDARLPDPIKSIRLGDSSNTSKVGILKHFGDTIACSYGNKLCLVHFPLLSDKND